MHPHVCIHVHTYIQIRGRGCSYREIKPQLGRVPAPAALPAYLPVSVLELGSPRLCAHPGHVGKSYANCSLACGPSKSSIILNMWMDG